MRLLSVENLCAGYGAIQVLRNVSLTVDKGEIVTLIGANGAGKSTTLRAISRLIPATGGSIRFKETDLLSVKPHAAACMGISHVPEGRGIFGNLTVEENLKLASFASPNRRVAARQLALAYELFPLLDNRRYQLSSTLSGGEQQMLAIGRALVSDGELLILDEPSMGLSPLFVKNVFSIIADINKQGKTILLVEQNATMALKYAHRGYVLENGRVVLEGTGAELLSNEAVRKAYLG